MSESDNFTSRRTTVTCIGPDGDVLWRRRFLFHRNALKFFNAITQPQDVILRSRTTRITSHVHNWVVEGDDEGRCALVSKD